MVDFLNHLPYIPKCFLFRYLDTATLHQVRLANRAVNNFVKSNRHRLCKTEIGYLRIMENTDETTNASEYCVQIVKCKLQWPLETDTNEYLKRYYNARKIMVRSKDMTSFLYWLTSSHTEIGLFELEGCSFDYKGDFSPHRKQSKCRTKRVSISCVTFSEQDTDGISRFLAYLKPEELHLYNCKQTELRKFLSPYFYQMVFPLLDALVIFSVKISHVPYLEENLPADVDRFPKRMTYTYPAIIPFETIQRAIQTWWKGESEIVFWKIQIPIEYSLDINLLAKILDFPYRFGWHQPKTPSLGGDRRRCIEIFRPIDKQRLIIAPSADIYGSMYYFKSIQPYC